MTANTIDEALLRIRERIENARIQAKRNDSVLLIGISKTHPAEALQEAFRAGLRDFGENRVQEALPKIAAANLRAVWHLVGHLQSNKANKAALVFDWVHSIDSIETAVRLARAAAASGRTIRALVEVNTSGEASKHGIAPEDTEAFVGQLHEALAPRTQPAAGGLVPSGYMTIGPRPAVTYSSARNEQENRRAFACLRGLRDRLHTNWPEMRELSMGMSGDFESAIFEGASMVRVGSAIFGMRT
jgi:pyridoxal phosphate enzyme (YggS family)